MTRSILDTDLYKLTMQNAVRSLYPGARATYRYTNRNPGMRFNQAAYEQIRADIKAMDDMRLTQPEYTWLKKTCPYLKKDYLDWLLDFKLDSDSQVRIVFDKADGEEFGSLDIASEWGRVADMPYSMHHMLRSTTISEPCESSLR